MSKQDLQTLDQPCLIARSVDIFDRESVELKRDFVAYRESKGITFHSTNTGQLMRLFRLNESPSWFDACCPTAKLWTVFVEFEHVRRLALLRVDNASNVALIKTIDVARGYSWRDVEFQVDDQFILHY